ncbi:MAG: peptidoglycan-binding protein [Patescibacteria group bacterium]
MNLTNQKWVAVFTAAVLILGQGVSVFAQLDTSSPTENIPEQEQNTTGPTFTSVQAVSVLPDELTVVWTMDEVATSYVEYGLSSSYGLQTSESVTASLEGTAIIAGLTPDTTYHYRVVAKDAAGNISYSSDHLMKTAAEPTPTDNEPPLITEVGVIGVATTTATITVITDELSEVRVEYGKTENYGSFVTAGEEFSLDHQMNITGLFPDTVYHYRVIAEDESGNVAHSFDNTFRTKALTVSQPTTTATTTTATSTQTTPTSTSEITESVENSVTTTVSTTTTPTATTTESVSTSETATPLFATDPLVVSVSTSTVKITWTTSEPATRQVLYGFTSSYGSSTIKGTNLSLNHSVVLIGLRPETSYRYGIRSEAADGQNAAIDNLEFTTLPRATVAVQPHISNVQVSQIGTSTARIIWTTNVPTEGDLHYGTSTAYVSSAGKHSVRLIDHVHEVQGLSSDTAYHYQATVTDEAGNTTISKDRTFRTDSFSGIEGSSFEENNTVLLPDPPDITPPPPVLIGGVRPPTSLPKPQLIKADALESQVLFVFDKKSPNDRIRVVRRNAVSPRNAWDGKIVYEGTAKSFTDTGLINNHTYHYGIYHVSQFRGASKGILLAATPTVSEDQTELEATPVSAAKTPYFVFEKNFGIGATGRDVVHLQVLLATEEKLYPQGLVTGYFGSLTQSALIRFQEIHKLRVTGVVDGPTRTKLESYSALRYLSENDPAFSRDLSLGVQGDDVAVLQRWLVKEGYYPEAIFSGYFGPLTKKAVVQFQVDNGIVPANGYVGIKTRTQINSVVGL